MKRLLLLPLFLFLIGGCSFTQESLTDRVNKETSTSIIKYEELILSLEEGKVSRIFIPSGYNSKITFKDGKEAEVDIKGEKNLLKLLIKNDVDFASTLWKRKNCSFSKTNQTISSAQISYGRFLEYIKSGRVTKVDIYCQNYALLTMMDTNYLLKTVIPELTGVTEDLKKRLEENQIKYDHYE